MKRQPSTGNDPVELDIAGLTSDVPGAAPTKVASEATGEATAQATAQATSEATRAGQGAAPQGPARGKARRQLTFRARWALTVAATFAGAGALLVAGEYLLVTNVMPPTSEAVVTVATPFPDTPPATDQPTDEPTPQSAPPSNEQATNEQAIRDQAAAQWAQQQQAEADLAAAQAQAAQQLVDQATKAGIKQQELRVTTVEERRAELNAQISETTAQLDQLGAQAAAIDQQEASAKAAGAINDTLIAQWQAQRQHSEAQRAQLGQQLAAAQTELDSLASSSDKDITLRVDDGASNAATITSSGSDPISVTYNYSLTVTDSQDGGAVAPVTVGNSLDSQVATGLLDVQRSLISSHLSTALIGWSVVLVLAFALLAGALAWWLAGRGTRRIAQVTALARDMSAQDLTKRLDLPGPRDEIKELGDTFDSMLERIEHSFDAQRRFVANASHELRTPLTTTRAALEIPLAQGRVPADLEPDVATALAANARSQEIIASLLTLARATGTAQPTAQPGAQGGAPVPLDDVVREVAAGLGAPDAAPQGSGDGEITWHMDLGEAIAVMEPGWATQAVGNLLRNAVVHNHDGGEVWVSTGMDGPDAYVEVSNTGAVLSPHAVAQLTEPFFRGEETRLAGAEGKEPGLGLGLSIVDSIAQASGADLLLSPREGGGLVARLVLPGLDDDLTAE